jgi:hypothetical protein
VWQMKILKSRFVTIQKKRWSKLKQLDGENLKKLMLFIHEIIDKAAESAVDAIKTNNTNNKLCYPPGIALSDDEISVLSQIRNIEGFEDVLKKVIADSSSSTIFDLFNIIDGTADIEDVDYDFLDIVECDFEERTDRTEFLHDYFYETYWDWEESKN